MTAILINPYALTPVIPAATREYRALKAVASQSSRFFTITGVDIGAAAVGREVVIEVFCAFGGAYKAFTSATIGGVAATVHVNLATSSVVAYATAIISAPLDAGTTATVELEFTSGASSYEVWLASYRVLGLVSRTASDTASATAAADGSKSVTIDVQDDGLLFAGCINYNGAGFTLTGVTKDYDSAVGGSRRVVGGSLEVTATESNRTVTFDITDPNTFRGPIVAAAFR